MRVFINLSIPEGIGSWKETDASYRPVAHMVDEKAEILGLLLLYGGHVSLSLDMRVSVPSPSSSHGECTRHSIHILQNVQEVVAQTETSSMRL